MEINSLEDLEIGIDEFNKLLDLIGLNPSFDEKYYGFWDFIKKNNVKFNVPLDDAIQLLKRKLGEF